MPPWRHLALKARSGAGSRACAATRSGAAGVAVGNRTDLGDQSVGGIGASESSHRGRTAEPFVLPGNEGAIGPDMKPASAGCAPPGSPSRATARGQSEGEPGPGRNGYWAPGCMALFHPVGRRCDLVNCRAGEHEGVRGRHDTEGNEAESGDLAKAGRVSADDRLPQRGQSERRPWPLQRRWRHSSEQDAGSPTVQTGADFFVTSGDSRSHQRDRTPVPSALRLSIAAMPMKRPPAPPSRFSIIVESTKFFVTPCTSA